MNQMGGINLVVVWFCPFLSSYVPVSNLEQYYVTSVLQYNVGLSRKLSLLLGGVIQIMFVIGKYLQQGINS